MIELRPAIEDEMIAAFLQAEIESTRYSDKIALGLALVRQTRVLIDSPNLADPTENLARRVILAGYRGYDLNTGLFENFPRWSDITWSYVELESSDFGRMRYINDARSSGKVWHRLTRGTYLVVDGAKNIDWRYPPIGLEHLPAVLAELRNGRVFPPLIAAARADGSLTVIEGHSRATAYAAEGKTDVKVFVGNSARLSSWVFY